MREGGYGGLGATGSPSWWNEVKGRCLAGGAGVTGTVLLDGVGFKLGSHTPCPNVTVNPGGAIAGWLQTDPFTFTGYPD